MDFTTEAAGEIPAGDKNQQAKNKYQPSDIGGFVNPIVNGVPDTSKYIPEAAAGSGNEPVFSRDEALKQGQDPADVLYGKRQ